VAPGDATALATGGAAAVVVDTSVVARACSDARAGCSVKRGIEPLIMLAALRGRAMPRPVWHVVLDRPVFADVTVRHVDVVWTQPLSLPICRHVTRLTWQVRTPPIVAQVSARAVQRILHRLGVHVNGSGAGGGITGVPRAVAASIAGDAAVAGAAVAATTSSSSMTAHVERAGLRPSRPPTVPHSPMAAAYAGGRSANI
jgi:hypothetical protein